MIKTNHYKRFGRIHDVGRCFSTSVASPYINILKVPSQMSIFEQLKLEEAILRNDEHNWCILNSMARDSANANGAVVTHLYILCIIHLLSLTILC